MLTGSDVAVRSGERRRRGVGAVVGDTVLTEVGEASLVPVAQEDVVGLDVTVDDPWHAIMVQVREPTAIDREPHLPLHDVGAGRAGDVQQTTESALRLVVVEEEARPAV